MYKLLWKIDGRLFEKLFADRLECIVYAGWLEAKGARLIIAEVDNVG